tara:strand:+ start:154 stop:531 length:378 start_codon:yes stop_codon:yes gene_type:complete
MSQEDVTECLICFETYDVETAWKCNQCNNTCHQYCIEKWYKINKTCPFCREPIPNDQLVYIIEVNDRNRQNTSPSNRSESSSETRDVRLLINIMNDYEFKSNREVILLNLANLGIFMMRMVYLYA